MASRVEGFSSFCFSTEDYSPASRLPTWYDIAGRAVPRRIFSPLSDGPFRVDITSRRLPGPCDASAGTGVCVERMTFTAGFTAQLTPEILADGIDDVLLLVHEPGRCMVSQLGREATLRPGEASSCQMQILTHTSCRNRVALPLSCYRASP